MPQFRQSCEKAELSQETLRTRHFVDHLALPHPKSLRKPIITATRTTIVLSACSANLSKSAVPRPRYGKAAQFFESSFKTVSAEVTLPHP